MGIENHQHHNETARRRWGLLAQALQTNRQNQRNIDTRDNISVRRISNFGLIQITPLVSDWFLYSTGEKYDIRIHHLNQALTPEDLMGFNNTGNVCVWPSEEVLAYYVLCNLRYFADRSVLELGGGMSCLAGLFIAKYTSASYILLTDGNKNSVSNVKRILKENDLSEKRVDCRILEWGELPEDKYDIVLAADCLFFDNTRKDLVFTMWHSMKNGGSGLVTAPRRGSTLNQFLEEAQNIGFKYCVSDCYNQDIWERHLKLQQDCPYYDANIHYPVFILLTKSINVE